MRDRVLSEKRLNVMCCLQLLCFPEVSAAHGLLFGGCEMLNHVSHILVNCQSREELLSQNKRIKLRSLGLSFRFVTRAFNYTDYLPYGKFFVSSESKMTVTAVKKFVGDSTGNIIGADRFECCV